MSFDREALRKDFWDSNDGVRKEILDDLSLSTPPDFRDDFKEHIREMIANLLERGVSKNQIVDAILEEVNVDEEPRPIKQCDLVMKGGITSGVIYPAAVLALKDQFRFRSIGGTSAGAIAAAPTGAAEMGREIGGFEKLQKVRVEIQSQTFFRKLFRTSGPTSPLLSALVSWTTYRTTVGKWFGVLWLLVRHAWIAAIIGAWVGLGRPIVPQSFKSLGIQLISDWRPFVHGLVGGTVGALVAAALYVIYILFFYLPRRGFFGLCKGYVPGNNDVLTSWLHVRIQQLAGRTESSQPLTFADLAAKCPPTDNGEDWRIDLRMMTSNLSQRQPYVFPRPDPDKREFIFDHREFGQLFPPDVMKYMVEYQRDHNASSARSHSHIKLAEHYFFLPPGDHLPVLIATRMSLSFPLLLSAIPLYTIKPQAFADIRSGKIAELAEDQLQRNWISDGGISSNFPIHFFDSFLPSRPTFGINLNYLSSNDSSPTPRNQHALSENDSDVVPSDPKPLPDVSLPPLQMARYTRPQWKPIDALTQFFGAIFGTAKDYRDQMQMMLPSYRDRVVQVWLTPDQGGFNLAMPAETIQLIDDKGVRAGDCLRTKMNFPQHQWVRLRVLMAALEPQLRRMRTTFPDLARYTAMLDQQRNSDPSWYKAEKAIVWCEKATANLKLLVDFLDQWQAMDPDFGKPDPDTSPAFWGVNAPHPSGVLRVMPDA